MISLRLIGIGIFFALAGIGLFAMTLKKPAQQSSAPVKKSELRQQAIEQSNTMKLRVAGAVMVVVGAVLTIMGS